MPLAASHPTERLYTFACVIACMPIGTLMHVCTHTNRSIVASSV